MLANDQEEALIELLEIINDLHSIDDKTDISGLLSRIAASAVKVFDANHAGIVLFDENKPSGTVIASTDDSRTGATNPLNTIKPKKAFPKGTSTTLGVVRDIMSEFGIASTVVVPLLIEGNLIGSIGIDYIKRKSFTDRQVRMMQLFANQATIALNRLKLTSSTPNVAVSLSNYFSCFISYSARNEEFVNKLYNDLQRQQVECWFAPADMKIGDKIRTKIDDVIEKYDKLLLVLSESSINSQWVEQEVETALEEERKKRLNMLFPIRLDDKVMKARSGWVRYIRNTRNIGDFTNWSQEDAYQESLHRLLRDLRKKS